MGSVSAVRREAGSGGQGGRVPCGDMGVVGMLPSLPWMIQMNKRLIKELSITTACVQTHECLCGR